MKGDFSRLTFDPNKHYTTVLMQQGRVEVDANSNEQQAIHQYRIETEAKDVIGLCGVPKTGGGFQIGVALESRDLTISTGRIYVDGILCELEATPISIQVLAANQVQVSAWFVDCRDFQPYQWVEIFTDEQPPVLAQIVDTAQDTRALTLNPDISGFSIGETALLRRITTYTTQPDYPDVDYTSQPDGEVPQLTLDDGTYLVYLDVWQRHITALDDPRIREVALGGADTATRLKTIGQVKILPIAVQGSNSPSLRESLDNLTNQLNRFGQAQSGTNRTFIANAVSELQQFSSEPNINLQQLQNFLRQVGSFLTSRFESFSGDPEQFVAILSLIREIIRIIESPDTVTCNSQFPEWDDLTAPSTGKLKARTQSPSDPDNPCLIPPTAGYQRLENQLYRVEIHQNGSLGTATFKWSRDNGSVVTTIEQISGNEVTVQDIGPDNVLGFTNGQWVEVLDDQLELKGLPGQLVQISDVNSATRVITLTSPPTPLADNPRGVEPAYHPKFRRWDSRDEITVEIPDTNDGWIPLEGGIEVKFTQGEYDTGNYWLIPARTATGEIEWPPYKLPNTDPLFQPPAGIDHHYCRLALVQVNQEQLTVIQDCRKRFPPLTELETSKSCCTLVVSTGEDIQAALDTLPANGGCICLKTGTHVIAQPIRIEKSNVVFKGESPGTRVFRRNGMNLLTISAPTQPPISNVIVEQIQWETRGVIPEESDSFDDISLVFIQNCSHVTINHCNFAILVTPQTEIPTITQAIGILLINTSQVKIHDNQIRQVTLGIWGESCTTLNVSRNEIAASTLSLDNLPIPTGYIGILINNTPAVEGSGGVDCAIEDNQIENYWMGIFAGLLAERSLVRRNHILRPTLTLFRENLAQLTQNVIFPNEPYIYGIITLASHCLIADNYLELNSAIYGGIRVLGAHTRIEGNQIRSNPPLSRLSQLPIGIVLSLIQQSTDDDSPNVAQELLQLLPDSGIVQNNQLLGSMSGIVVLGTQGVQLLKNQIEGLLRTNPFIAITIGTALDTQVIGNQIRDAQWGLFLANNTGSRILTNHLSEGNFGIAATTEIDLELSENVIDNMKVAGVLGTSLLLTTKITHNRITHCGYEGFPPQPGSKTTFGAGIVIVSSFVDLSVESCEVLNTGVSREGQSNTNALYYGIGVNQVPVCRISHNLVGYNDPAKLAKLDETKEHRTLLLIGLFNETPFGLSTVTDNVFTGLGLSYLVQVFGVQLTDLLFLAFEKVIFSNNACEHFGTKVAFRQAQTNPATVYLAGTHVIVMGNHIKENPKTRNSIDFNYVRKVVFMGNLTTGNWSSSGTVAFPTVAVPTEFANFNAQV